ncbi:MAG: type IX secretion system membrane protein PorP/SprF [Bacteroidota bacterium]|nr:type IX secretion system membrane protein PorP/SprF [Bacteroidota bacterium]
MRSKGYILPVLIGLLLATSAMAQDPQFSQFYAAPQYLNPALTGNTQQDRVALNYRLQWPGVQPGFETYSFAYDHRFAGLNCGLGGWVLKDKAGSNGLGFTSIAINYSYEARLNHRHAFRTGLRLGYTMRGVDPTGFLFADQVIRDNASRSIEMNIVQGVNYLDIATGGMFYSERFWIGASFNHINRPNQSLLMNGEARLPMRTSVHAGYVVALDGRRFSKSDTRLTLASHYKAQGKWDQFDLGGYIDHHRLSAGLWYRGLPLVKAYQPGYGNSEAVILMVGVSTESQLRFTYSYDITISKLSMRSAGAHEISLIYEWPRKHKGRRHKVVPCPKF